MRVRIVNPFAYCDYHRHCDVEVSGEYDVWQVPALFHSGYQYNLIRDGETFGPIQDWQQRIDAGDIEVIAPRTGDVDRQGKHCE